MDSAKQRLETLFSEALELPDAAARAALLDQKCGDDPALRNRVERQWNQLQSFLADKHWHRGLAKQS